MSILTLNDWIVTVCDDFGEIGLWDYTVLVVGVRNVDHSVRCVMGCSKLCCHILSDVNI